MSASRESAIEQIRQERERQVEKLGWSPGHDSEHTPEEWVWLIQKRTTDLLSPERTEPTRHLFSQIGALAAAAIEALP